MLWLRRAHENLRALGVGWLEYTPWEAFYFTVPVLNLIRPFQVVREVWKTSGPDLQDEHSWQSTPTPPLIWLWWTLFLISAGGMPFGGLTGNVARVAAAICAVLVVAGIDRRQEMRFRSVSSSPGPCDPQ